MHTKYVNVYIFIVCGQHGIAHIDNDMHIYSHIAANRTVYVHCNAGKGRSSVVVAAYLMYTEDKWLSAKEVVKYLRSKRDQVSFGLLDWPLRAQARAVVNFFELVKVLRLNETV